MQQESEVEDEYASVYGHFCFSLRVARFRVLGPSEDDARAIVELFKADMEIYDRLLKDKDKNAAYDQVTTRHVLQLAPNKQNHLAIQELGDSAFSHPDFKDLQEERANTITATQLVDDINGVQSARANAPCRQYRKMAIAWLASWRTIRSARSTSTRQTFPSRLHQRGRPVFR